MLGAAGVAAVEYVRDFDEHPDLKGRNMKRSLMCALAAVGFVLVGCERDEYELTITPQGETVERRLTVSRTGGSAFPEDKLKQLGRIYPQHVVETSSRNGNTLERYVFTGRFKGNMPNDVGGAGSYAHFDSQMGSAGLYLERFRGNDDVAGVIDARLRSCDRITDLLAGWLKTEFGSYKDFPKIRRFMDEDFRGDLKNMAMYEVLYGNVDRLQDPKVKPDRPPDTPAGPEPPDTPNASDHRFFRMLQYLTERDYLRPEDWPQVQQIIHEDHDGPGFAKAVRPLLEKFLARKMGVKDKRIIERTMGWVEDPAALQKSLEDYLRGTKEYKKMVADWKAGQERSERKDGQPPPPMEVLGLDAIYSMPSLFPVAAAELQVEFIPEGPVLKTNGTLDGKTGRVKWDGYFGVGQHWLLPKLCYVVWARPDEAFQKGHFGKVVLDGMELVEYAIWRKGMDERRAREWDALIAGLRPDHESYVRLGKFRFGDEPTTQPAEGTFAPPHSCSAGVIRQIQRALDYSPTTRPAK